MKYQLKKISASGIRDYLSCPELFYFRHFLGLRFPITSIDLTFGSAVHKGLEVINKSNNLKNAEEAFLKIFDIDELTNNQKFSDYLTKGLYMIKEYRDQKPALEKELNIEFESAEKYFKLPLTDLTTNEPLNIFLTGRIDMIPTSPKIVEYKTSSRKYSQEKVDELIQATTYALAHSIINKTLPDEIVYIVFLKNNKKKVIQTITTKRTQEDINNLIGIIKQIKQKVENGQFDRPDDHNLYCDCIQYRERLLL